MKPSSGVPMVEKHRPKNFEDIVLDPLNKKILRNIIETSNFPNLLFYGPPGTGKTTTIINLINAYQMRLNMQNKDLVIHLNASDERGIDIIRNQINFFVNSKPLFNTGMKFVILDEVDYMTKNAQQALRYLLQNFTTNVRFCLICNYISKIDEGLQNDFIRLRFNQLPKEDIVQFLTLIAERENLFITPKTISSIQQLYKSDIRRMINFIQSNMERFQQQEAQDQDPQDKVTVYIIDTDVWERLIGKLVQREKLSHIEEHIHKISTQYNIDKKNIMKDFIYYIIRNHPKYVTHDFLKFTENLMHSTVENNKVYINYSLSRLTALLSGV
jgi:replication factor C subunit 3/5